ncbi:MAG: ABC transporter ATP-binding protein [Deltaproteobacteria bacterium]|nr:ABC transporter ATP-binding protein [Deltaproteobacteria bacterium]
MIIIEGLKKSFQKDGKTIEVLRGVDIEIPQGERLAILGVSGAGKTTLLQIIGLLDQPSSGKIFCDGVDVLRWREEQRAGFRNGNIGFVFQFHHLLPEFTALENVLMPCLIGGISMAEARHKAEVILTDVGLGDRLRHKPGELSGGEQQRVAIARSMVMTPRLLLADEPTGNLDTETGERIQELLLTLSATKGTTLIVVTHNIVLANRMSHIIGLRDGMIYEA